VVSLRNVSHGEEEDFRLCRGERGEEAEIYELRDVDIALNVGFRHFDGSLFNISARKTI
jgi:hypothetical protein